jgi:transposase-like protein
MAIAAHDHHQCTRCQEWKHVNYFHTDAALPESRYVCRDCFSDWLDEEAARERRH